MHLRLITGTAQHWILCQWWAQFTSEWLFFIMLQIQWKLCFVVITIYDHQITTKFCICHCSTAVLACAKFCTDHVLRTWVSSNCNFYWIWIKREDWWVNWIPGHHQQQCPHWGKLCHGSVTYIHLGTRWLKHYDEWLVWNPSEAQFLSTLTQHFYLQHLSWKNTCLMRPQHHKQTPKSGESTKIATLPSETNSLKRPCHVWSLKTGVPPFWISCH